MLSRITQPLLPFMKPDLTLVQSPRTEAYFTARGFPTRFCALSGIDIQRFQPVFSAQKARFRARYGIPSDAYVVLHVGHLKAARNLTSLTQLQTLDHVYVVIVGSRSTGIESPVYTELTASGCHVITEYLADIHEVYALADCYVFPVVEQGCIELPLSVLEAMACNLPVIATRFGGLERVFPEGHGLMFVRDFTTLPRLVAHLQQSSDPINTRAYAQAYSWPHIAQNLITIYQQMLHRPPSLLDYPGQPLKPSVVRCL
jgi:glycosyltransferase involved in cell wall biosynthesis